MNGRPKASFEFGEYRLIPAERLLLKDGSPIQLPPKAFDILVVLVENTGELVDNKRMLELVWPDSFVEEANIQVQMSSIRKALGENGNRHFVETVPKVGYRFIAKLKQTENGSRSEEPPVPSDPAVHQGLKSNDNDPASSIFSPKRSRLKTAAIFAAILIASSTLIVFGFLKQRSSLKSFDNLSQRMKLSKLTDSGAAFAAAISPDGKYAVYQSQNDGKYSIWLMDLGSKSSVQIVPPGVTVFSGLTFSTGDDSIYYLAANDPPNTGSSVYQMPRFGGDAKKILAPVNSPIGFSADGKRFAFIRQNLEAHETAVMIANADGSNEQTVAVRKSPDVFSVGSRPAYSPDGKTIACIGINSGEKFLRVLIVNNADGTVRNLTSENWSSLQDVIWMPDSDRLLVTAQDDIKYGPSQIWSTSISGGGAAVKITPELRAYVGLGMTADSGSIITTQTEALTDIWIGSNNIAEPPKQILSIKGGGRIEMSWTPEGRIVYTSNAAGDTNIYIMNADGSNQTQLTTDAYEKRSPSVSPDGRQIVFVSSQRDQERLWIMEINGQNQRQIGSDKVSRYPQFSPDGKWIIYTTWDKDKKTAQIWKISVDGGVSVMLHDESTFTPNISPDTKLIAYIEDDKNTGKRMISIVPMEGDEVIKSWEVPSNTLLDSMRWAPNGQGVTYRCSRNNTANYWLQQISESEPRQLTDLKYDFPYYFSGARNMKQFSFLRQNMIRDVVMFSIQ